MKKLTMLAVTALLVAQAAEAAQVRISAPFRKQAQNVAKTLKVTAGKEFSAGYVFVCGQYLPPPYKVERYGSVIRINGIQVTDPVVEWEDFVKTQTGARQWTEADFAKPEDTEKPPEPIDDIHDLYADGSESDLKPLVVEKTAEEREKERNPLIGQWTFDGEFVRNERANELLAKVNKLRTKYDAALRGGGYVFFSPKYAPVVGEPAMATHLIDKLPKVMKENVDAESFAAAARTANLAFLPPAVIADLFRHRVDYSMLMGRRKK